MPLHLRYYGDPILQTRCKEVEEITPEIRELVSQMIKTMDAHGGCGLAAPQVGHLIRLFITNVEGVDKNGYVIYGTPRGYVNPVVTSFSTREWEMTEGCLSLPYVKKGRVQKKNHIGVDGIKRPWAISIEATDLDGKVIKQELEGFPARNFLHELDHLNGVMIVDRCSPDVKKTIEPFLEELKAFQKSSSSEAN